MTFEQSDGGRRWAGFRHIPKGGDCAVRAAAHTCCLTYREAHRLLSRLTRWTTLGLAWNADHGIHVQVFGWWLKRRGFKWTTANTTLDDGRFRDGIFVVALRVARAPRWWGLPVGHLTGVVDGVIYDTFDPRTLKDGSVIGYWSKP